MKMIFLLISSLFFGREVKAEIVEIISDKYIQGPYLVYDCQDQHWVCTEESQYKNCESSLNKAMDDKNSYLPCLPIEGKFKSHKDCVSGLQKFLGQTQIQSQCLHPDVRRHFIEFQ